MVCGFVVCVLCRIAAQKGPAGRQTGAARRSGGTPQRQEQGKGQGQAQTTVRLGRTVNAADGFFTVSDPLRFQLFSVRG